MVPVTPCGPGKRWQQGGNKGHGGHEQHPESSCPTAAPAGAAATTLGRPTTVAPGQEPAGVSPVSPSLRSVQGLDAGHTVLEAVCPQAGHVIIHDLHLAPGVPHVLKQVDLVVGAVLGERAAQGLSPESPCCPQCRGQPGTALLTIWRGRRDIRLSLLWLLDHESQRG